MMLLTLPGCHPNKPSMKAVLVAVFSTFFPHFLFHPPVSPQAILIPPSLGFILPQPTRVRCQWVKLNFVNLPAPRLFL